MSTIALNGSTVISGSVTIPYYGAWVADVIMASSSAVPTTPMGCSLAIGDLTLVGTAVRTASFSGSRSARIVGGAGGWRKALPAKGYSHPGGLRLSAVLNDVARESGESVAIASALDREIGTSYARESAKAERTIHLLTNGSWWVDPSGKTQITTRDGSAVVSPFTVAGWSGGKGKFDIASEAIATWLPGRTFTAPTVSGTQTVSAVTITAENEGKLRLSVLSTSVDTERLRTTLRALIRQEIAALTYMGVWEYTIVACTSATVDATPSSSLMPPLTGVPMQAGLLGEVVLPTVGSKCRVWFVNGDPTRPECVGIVGSPVLSKLSGGLLGAARITDPVQAGPFAGVITRGSTKVLVG
jgi:hypothetical protein